MDTYKSAPDYEDGKVLKYLKPNPIGENIYLNPDGTITWDEDKIVNVQRIFKHNYYKPGGKGSKKVLKKYES